ncbi:MAG: heat-inducible transcriptional repressor HrcA [Vicinamibacterales bacterium]
MASDLTERQRRLLARLVAEYIEQGEPVSSAWLARHSDLGLSSATVRNVLAHLESMGLLRQPHTSAGRVPTDSGYRLYVDTLIGTRRRSRALPDVEARLRQAGTVSQLLENASQEVSRASSQVGFAMTPADPSTRLQHIDFVRLEDRKVLVIVVAAGGRITHKVIETDEPCDATLLAQAANYVNREFAGLTLHEARAAVAERMRRERMLYDALMARALPLAQRGLAEIRPEDTLRVQGTSLLIDELIDDTLDRDRALEALRALFRVIEEKHRLMELLTGYLECGGLTVVIGREHGSPELQPFSVVASTFQDGGRLGTVGVIGPTRMRYQRAIAVVEGVSRAVTRVLEGQ